MLSDSVKVERDRVRKVKKSVKNTGMTITGFIALAIDEKIERDIQNIKAADVVRVLFNLH